VLRHLERDAPRVELDFILGRARQNKIENGGLSPAAFAGGLFRKGYPNSLSTDWFA
jgi:hypothetical protein